MDLYEDSFRAISTEQYRINPGAGRWASNASLFNATTNSLRSTEKMALDSGLCADSNDNSLVAN